MPSRAAKVFEVHGPDPFTEVPALVRAAGVGVFQPTGRIERVRPVPAAEAKWSARRTIAVAGMASLSLWGLIGAGIYFAAKAL